MPLFAPPLAGETTICLVRMHPWKGLDLLDSFQKLEYSHSWHDTRLEP